ncbi:YhcG family protein [Lewinella sp. LCG006]|uniref:PDDEXK nuclease domain-containing protein n=1 Tax=Lewinella sp. LCG006 TaxID=3231911 RepID=UPI0034616828
MDKHLENSNQPLFNDIRQLIEDTRKRVHQAVNAGLTLMYWNIGKRINEEVLQSERAEYGKAIVATLSRELTQQFGRGYTEKNLWRMMQFHERFPEHEIVATLSRELTWSHFVLLLPIQEVDKRNFYAEQIAAGRWSVRQTRHHISRKVYERTQLGNLQLPTEEGEVINSFKDPYILDFLGLKEGYMEEDLEGAILKELESFILELGTGFSFVARQKRMVIDGRDFYLDLLFFHRKLRRLVAIELKIGEFEAAHKGQMELYLRWLNKHERQEHENAPIGLILCAEASSEQVELLEMHKDGIMVAEYWTELPPKALLEQKIHQAMVEARERLTFRQLS